MTRRELIALLVSTAALAWPRAVRAQPERVRRVSVLTGADEAGVRARYAIFVEALRPLGWTEGRNVRIDYRWGVGNADTISKHAAELGALAPDVILATGGPATERLLQAIRDVPIVFVIVPDPVGSGFV